MKSNETIHVPLSTYQSRMLEKLRRHMPSGYTEEDIQRYIVVMGFFSLDLPDEDIPFVDASEPTPPRPMDQSITLTLGEELRPRLERLLGLRPAIPTEKALLMLVELGLETLIELGVVREADIGRGEENLSSAWKA